MAPPFLSTPTLACVWTGVATGFSDSSLSQMNLLKDVRGQQSEKHPSLGSLTAAAPGHWVTQGRRAAWRTEQRRLPSGLRLSCEPEGVRSLLGVGSLAHNPPLPHGPELRVTDQRGCQRQASPWGPWSWWEPRPQPGLLSVGRASARGSRWAWATCGWMGLLISSWPMGALIPGPSLFMAFSTRWAFGGPVVDFLPTLSPAPQKGTPHPHLLPDTLLWTVRCR